MQRVSRKILVPSSSFNGTCRQFIISLADAFFYAGYRG
jgi:hypothetical protein